MASRLSVFLLESDNRAKNEIVALLKSFTDTVGKVTDGADFHDICRLMHADEPQIVFLEVQEIEQGVRETATLVSRFPLATVIVTATEKNPDWILRLIRAGAGEYLTKPIVAEELTVAVHKATRLLGQTKAPVNRGCVLSLYSPAGGMGTTTIAVNLAAALASLGEQVVLVDLNLLCGDVTTFLDLTPRYTLANITTRKGRIDASFLRSIITSHPSGVDILCAPPDLADADRVLPEQIQEIIAELQGIYTYTVIDTGGQLYGRTMTTLESSDRVLFVTLLNLPALRNAKRYLSAMTNENLGADKVKLVVNRYIPRDDITLADAEKVLSTKAYLAVPNADQDVKAAINRGVPLAECCPRSPVTKAMEEMAKLVIRDTK